MIKKLRTYHHDLTSQDGMRESVHDIELKGCENTAMFHAAHTVSVYIFKFHSYLRTSLNIVFAIYDYKLNITELQTWQNVINK